MEKYQCHNCRSVLYQAEGNVDSEMICPRCRAINYPYKPKEGEIILRGEAFQRTCITHRCDNCHRILVKTNGLGVIEIKCHSCKYITKHDTKLIRNGKFIYQRTELFKKVEKTVAK